MSRHRRADGTLRPTYRRYKQRKAHEERLRQDGAPERRAWLENFDPGARATFFRDVVHAQAIYLRAFASELGVKQEVAAPALEALADGRKWLKLKTKDGMCVGAAPLRRKEKKRKENRERVHGAA